MLPLVLTAAFGAPADPATFTAVGADDTAAGPLVALSLAESQVRTIDGPKTVKGLVELRRDGRPRPPFPGGAQLVTASGDRVPGAVAGGDAKTLLFRPAALDGDWLVPLDAVAAVWFRPPPADTPPDPGRYPWAAGSPPRDVLLDRNGDARRGAVTGFTRTGVLFVPDGRAAREVPFDDLTAVAFNPRFVRPRAVKGPSARLVLTDGTRLHVSDIALKGDVVTGAAVGPAVAVPLAKLAALDVRNGPAVDLSDLKPAKVETAGFLGDAPPWAADRSARGNPLCLREGGSESTFDAGLGTHPRTVLTYDLGGKYLRFEALVGLDAITGQRGRADVRVRVDGKEVPLPELKALAAGNAVPVRVDVSGAKELELVVDFGPTGGVRADVNWAGARLLGK